LPVCKSRKKAEKKTRKTNRWWSCTPTLPRQKSWPLG